MGFGDSAKYKIIVILGAGIIASVLILAGFEGWQKEAGRRPRYEVIQESEDEAFLAYKVFRVKDSDAVLSVISPFPTFPDGTLPAIGLTDAGLKIVREKAAGSILPPVSYSVVLPSGNLMGVTPPNPDFMDNHDVPSLTWTAGTASVASYRYGQYAYAWEDCYDGVTPEKFEAALTETGKTAQGSPVYELPAEHYPEVYRCLHGKTKRYVYDPATGEGVYENTVSYEEFARSHPMFFWRNFFGDLTAFLRSDVVPAAEKAKPVIYLYPEKSQRVSVRVAPVGGFSKTDPDYGNGWIVDATPNGAITNRQDGKGYPYLFWEGGADGVVETPKQGFVVKQKDVPSTLDAKLALFGLNKRERDDFLEFWIPRLSRAPYYFITFITRSEIDRVSPMTISPRPDTTIRVLMDYRPLREPIAVESLVIPSAERNGFTVVEWGGIVRD